MNACTLLATGGSTNHLIHWWQSPGPQASCSTGRTSTGCRIVPLLARVYPNGPQTSTTSNGRIHRARHPELLDAGLLHPDVVTVTGRLNPTLRPGGDSELSFGIPREPDPTVIRTVSDPFALRWAVAAQGTWAAP